MSTHGRAQRLLSWMLATGLLITVSACGPSQRDKTPTEKNLQALSVFYGRYVSQNKGVGPPNEEAFKKFIKGLPAAEFETFGVDPANVDALFTSPRDNEPYGIAWKSRGGMPGPDGAGMVIWEQKGVNGKRFVADAVGKIEEIDEATWNTRMEKTKKSQ